MRALFQCQLGALNLVYIARQDPTLSNQIFYLQKIMLAICTELAVLSLACAVSRALEQL